MTDRLNGVFVTFDRDIRDDDAEPILDAIRMIKGVLDVSPNITNISDYSARLRVQTEMREQIFKVLVPGWGEKK